MTLPRAVPRPSTVTSGKIGGAGVGNGVGTADVGGEDGEGVEVAGASDVDDGDVDVDGAGDEVDGSCDDVAGTADDDTVESDDP